MIAWLVRSGRVVLESFPEIILVQSKLSMTVRKEVDIVVIFISVHLWD